MACVKQATCSAKGNVAFVANGAALSCIRVTISLIARTAWFDFANHKDGSNM